MNVSWAGVGGGGETVGGTCAGGFGGLGPLPPASLSVPSEQQSRKEEIHESVAHLYTSLRFVARNSNSKQTRPWRTHPADNPL